MLIAARHLRTTRSLVRMAAIAPIAVLMLVLAGCGNSSPTAVPDVSTTTSEPTPEPTPTAETTTTPTPTEVAPTGTGVGIDASQQPVTNQTAPTESGGSAYYKNCAAVRAAGAAPLHTDDSGYRAGLDRDGDGTACE